MFSDLGLFDPQQSLVIFKLSRPPSFQLISHDFAIMANCGNYQMAMI